MRINYLILLSALILLLVLVLFFSLLLYRRVVKSRSGKIGRALKKHGKLIEKMMEEDPSVEKLSGQLRDLDNTGLVEVILDHCVSLKEVSASYYRDYYDAAGVTDRYIRLLKDSRSWKRRAFGAEKLGQIGSVKAVPLLIEIIRDVKNEDEDVRNVALRALGRIKDKRAIPILIEALGYPEVWLPPRIGEIIFNIGEKSIDPLIMELKNYKSENRRIWSAEILGWLEVKQAAIPLIETLSDISPEVRAKAVGALGKIKDGRAVVKLLEMLISDPVPFVRVRIAQALGAIGHPSVIDYLINILKDPEWWVRVRAVEALEQIGMSAVPGLLVALEDEDMEVRRRAAMALERMGYVDKLLIEYGEEDFKPELRNVLYLVIKAGVTEGISEKLFHSGIILQKRVVRLLGEAGNKKSSGALIELLHSTDDWSLRSRIIESLGRMGAKEAIPHIIKYLTGEEYWERTASVEALGKLDAGDYADQIADILDDSNPVARESALKALLTLRADSYREKIEKLLQDPSSKVRASAIGVIRELGLQVHKDTIAEHLIDASDEVRIEAIKYFAAALDVEVFGGITRLISSGSPKTRQEVVNYLVTVKPAPFEELLDLFGENNLSRDEISSFMKIASGLGEKRAYDFVLEYAESEDNVLRERAFLELSAFVGENNDRIFEKGLSDPSEGVRIASLIGGIGGSKVKSLMKKAATLSKDPIDQVRITFALACGVTRLPDFEPVLLKMIGDPSPRVVAAVLIGLASFDDPSNLEIIYEKGNVDSIREEIKEIENDPRFNELLWRIREKAKETRNVEVGLVLAPDEGEFVNVLIKRVKESPDEMNRINAMAALKLMARGEHFSSLIGVMKRDPSSSVRIKAMETMSAVGREDEVVSALSSMLVDPAIEVKVKAAEFLGDQEDPKALEALLHAIDTYDREFREAVTTSLSDMLMRDPARVNELIKNIPETKTRKLGMIWLMGKTRKRGCMNYLVNMLEDGDGDVRAAAVGALAKFKRKQMVSQLEKSLQDPNERVRAAAVNGIALSVDKGGFPLLEKMLSDVDDFVRKRAAIGLAKLDGTRAEKVVKKAVKKFPELEPFHKGILYGTGISYEDSVKIDGEAKKVVLELCSEEEMMNLAQSSSDTTKRLHAFRVLALSQNDAFREVMSAAVKDPSPSIREEAKKYMRK